MVYATEEKAPCARDCPGRSPTCHTECEKYKAWKAAREERIKPIRDQARINNGLNERMSKQKERWLRRGKVH